MTVERRAALVFVWCGALMFAVSLAIFLYTYLVLFGRPAERGPILQGALVDIALFTGFALHHSLFARTGAKAAVARAVSPKLERSVYTWTASILFIAVCVLWRPLPGELYRIAGPLAIVGYAIQILGVVLSGRGSAALGVLDLAGVRALANSRQEGAESPATLQTTGLYGFVRHPLYFAWVLFVFGTPHMTMTRFVFAIVSTAYLALAIPFEERGLVGVFGDDYRRYRRKVRWRMLPGVY